MLEHANAILEAFTGAAGIDGDLINAINAFTGLNPNEALPPDFPNLDINRLPWRIYLTARLDCWVEVPDWGTNVVHVQEETNSDRLQAFTVWLRRYSDDRECCRIHYRVISEGRLEKDDRFLAGRLVDDYMARGDSASLGVWDEQGYGAVPTAKSLKHCF